MTAEEKRIFVRGAGAMAVVLAASNFLVRYQVGDWLTLAAFTYPAAFLVTDCVNRTAGAMVARRVVYAGFAFGVPLSFIFIYADGGVWQTAAQIAVASGAAFFCAQLLDVAVFDKLRRAVWWRAPLLSSLPASAADTLLFFALAFAGSGVAWHTLALGDFAAKVLMVLVLLPPYRLITRKAAQL